MITKVSVCRSGSSDYRVCDFIFYFEDGTTSTKYSGCDCVNHKDDYPSSGSLSGRFLGFGFKRFIDNSAWRIESDSVSIFYDSDPCSKTKISATISNFTFQISATAAT